MTTHAFPPSAHDHAACIASGLDAAEALCAGRGERLTTLRRQVLETLLSEHRAMGAYEIIERMAERGRRPAPISVYRALDFLQAQGLVHRIERANAFIACAHPGARHGPQFLVCEGCGTVAEIADRGVMAAIGKAAREEGFEIHDPVIEVAGRCAACAEARP